MSTDGAALRRGDLYWLDWSPGRGSEQTGTRPALVVQDDAANDNPRYPLTVVVAVSTRRRTVPTHVMVVPSAGNGLSDPSCVKCEQLQTVSKQRLTRRIGTLGDADMLAVNAALRSVLAI